MVGTHKTGHADDWNWAPLQDEQTVSYDTAWVAVELATWEPLTRTDLLDARHRELQCDLEGSGVLRRRMVPAAQQAKCAAPGRRHPGGRVPLVWPQIDN